MEIPFTLGERIFDVAAQLVFHRFVSHNVSPPEVGFPLLEHRAEVQKDDIMLTNRQVRRILIIGSLSVAPRAHDAFVPIARDSEHAPGKCIDTLVDLAFLAPGRIKLCAWISANSALAFL
jgi:hypothetical protein